MLHVFLADTQSGVNRTEWTARYTPAGLRYAPIAVGDTVSNSLHLPPMGPPAAINAAAHRDFAAGMSEIRSDVQPDDAVRLMEQAVAKDPASAVAYAGLAEAPAFKSRNSHDSAWLDKARESVRQAELRHPDLPEVHVISGWMGLQVTTKQPRRISSGQSRFNPAMPMPGAVRARHTRRLLRFSASRISTCTAPGPMARVRRHFALWRERGPVHTDSGKYISGHLPGTSIALNRIITEQCNYRGPKCEVPRRIGRARLSFSGKPPLPGSTISIQLISTAPTSRTNSFVKRSIRIRTIWLS